MHQFKLTKLKPKKKGYSAIVAHEPLQHCAEEGHSARWFQRAGGGAARSEGWRWRVGVQRWSRRCAAVAELLHRPR